MLSAGDVLRARMILLLADGVSYQRIQLLLDTTAPTIARWKERFRQHRIAGLTEGATSRTKAVGEDAETTGQGAGRDQRRAERPTQWSGRKLASRFRVSKDTIQ
jgi:hypothetical protein